MEYIQNVRCPRFHLQIVLSHVLLCLDRVAAAVMKQAHSEGVATREQAIAAIEKDLRAFGDDKQVRRTSFWNVAHTSHRSRCSVEHFDHNLPSRDVVQDLPYRADQAQEACCNVDHEGFRQHELDHKGHTDQTYLIYLP